MEKTPRFPHKHAVGDSRKEKLFFDGKNPTLWKRARNEKKLIKHTEYKHIVSEKRRVKMKYSSSLELLEQS